MKLVKARPKSLEMLRPEFKCCEARLAAIYAEGEIILDISRTEPGENGLTCMYCNADMPNTPVVPDVNEEWVHIEEYDLDEGEYAP